MATKTATNFLHSTLIVLASSCSMLCLAEEYDVYLLAGQSNMDGRGKASELPTEFRAPIGDATIFYRNEQQSSDGWQPLGPGFSVPPGFKSELPSPTFGPELAFAHEMLKRKGTPLALIKGSRGGSSLREKWKPGSKGEPNTQGPQYRDFVQTIAIATKALEEQGHQYTIRGVLWHQGESDSKSSQQVYADQLRELIRRIREDVAKPNLPFVVGEVYDNGKRDQTRAAISAIAEESPTVGLVTSEGTQTSDAGTHFDASSQLLLGTRYAQEMQKLLDQ